MLRRPLEITQFTPVAVRDSGAGDMMTTVHGDGNGTLWIGTAEGALLRRSGDVVDMIAARGSLGSSVQVILHDRDGNIWIGTRNGGLMRWHDSQLRTLYNGPLAYEDLGALFEDDEGSLWIGSSGAGLLRLRNGKFASYGQTEGLASDNVWSIVPRGDSGLWIGTSGGLSTLVNGVLRSVALPKSHAHILVRGLSRFSCDRAILPTGGTLWLSRTSLWMSC